MTLTISLSPESEARLRTKAAAVGQPLDVFAVRILEEAAAAPPAASVDQRTVDLLRSWNAEDATDDPAELAARQREWDAFAAAINAYHPSNRKVYP
jgi:hypothetical protein